jgi:hypothetical protein
MKHEYNEGPEAKERFEKLATRLFRVPKSTVKQPVRTKESQQGLVLSFAAPLPPLSKR